jgi:CBS domain-containing protein
MNNVAVLALLMPLDLQAARRAKRSPAETLMPLSFASILGGMMTLIGTPPNIVIATFRSDALGAPFIMFDFAPMGVTCVSPETSILNLAELFLNGPYHRYPVIDEGRLLGIISRRDALIASNSRSRAA